MYSIKFENLSSFVEYQQWCTNKVVGQDREMFP